MQQFSCVSSADQEWNLIATNILRGQYIVQNQHSGLCLDVYQASFRNGTPVVQWPCNTNDVAQQFFIQGQNTCNSCFVLYTQGDGDGHVVEVYNWSTSNGGKVDICREQQWLSGS